MTTRFPLRNLRLWAKPEWTPLAGQAEKALTLNGYVLSASAGLLVNAFELFNVRFQCPVRGIVFVAGVIHIVNGAGLPNFRYMTFQIHAALLLFLLDLGEFFRPFLFYFPLVLSNIQNPFLFLLSLHQAAVIRCGRARFAKGDLLCVLGGWPIPVMDPSVIVDPLVNVGLDTGDKRREKNNSAYDRGNTLGERRGFVNQFHARVFRQYEVKSSAATLRQSVERNFSTDVSGQRLHKRRQISRLPLAGQTKAWRRPSETKNTHRWPSQTKLYAGMGRRQCDCVGSVSGQSAGEVPRQDEITTPLEILSSRSVAGAVAVELSKQRCPFGAAIVVIVRGRRRLVLTAGGALWAGEPQAVPAARRGRGGLHLNGARLAQILGAEERLRGAAPERVVVMVVGNDDVIQML